MDAKEGAKTKVSVIIPVYNVEKYLKTCVDSVLKQTYTELEILLIDDESSDKSGEICDSYINEDARIKVFHKKNEGVSAARNFGIERAEGEWLFFVDSDDWIDYKTVEAVMSYVDNTKDVCLIGYKETNGLEKEKVLDLNKLSVKDIARQDFLGLEFQILNRDRASICNREIIKLSSPWKIYRKEMLDKHNIRFPEDLVNGEDGMFNLEVYRHARGGLMMENVLYYYRQREESVTRKYSVNADKNFYCLQKHYEKFFGEEKDPEMFTEILDERAIWSMGFCCMLKYCHKDNPESYKVRRKQFLATWENDYADQIKRVSLKNFGVQKKILFWAIKRRWFGMISVLCYLNSRK